VQLIVRKVSILGLPLVAVILGVMLMSWSFTQKANAAVDPAVNLSLSAAGCVPANSPAACSEPAGSTFVVSFNVLSEPAAGWAGYDLMVTWTGNVNYIQGSLKQKTSQDPGVWPACDSATGEGTGSPPSNLTGTTKVGTTPAQWGNGSLATACAGLGGADQNYLGTVAKLSFACKDSGTGTITMVHGDANSDLVDGTFASHSEAAPPATEALDITCVPGPTATPIPPTPTPPAQPRVQKLPALQNIFLTRQGDKIPPATCETGTDDATLNESINIPIVSQDPKNPLVFQQLAAFQFEARFDDKLVCVSIAAGTLFSGPTVACSTVSAKGLVRIGCVTIGKGAGINGPGTLAVISVRPQEELYSQLRPNQDNGIPVQILNQGCNLADEQGHVIPIFSCEDADITFRYLEGDVSGLAPTGGPDCAVDLADAANMAFRWGAATGNLLYSSFLDLSPSGQIKGDGRIDVKDLQFVYGRLGSRCADDPLTTPVEGPHPPQDPVNPKA